MLTALSVVILYLGSVMEVLDLTVAVLASIIVLFANTELGGKYALAVYAGTSVLSFLLVPNKWMAVYFIMLFGLMPITKKLFEKTGKIFSWVLKIALFNAEALAFYFIAREFGFFAENESGTPFLLAMLLLANAAFVLIDILYTLLLREYERKYRARIRKFLK